MLGEECLGRGSAEGREECLGRGSAGEERSARGRMLVVGLVCEVRYSVRCGVV